MMSWGCHGINASSQDAPPSVTHVLNHRCDLSPEPAPERDGAGAVEEDAANQRGRAAICFSSIPSSKRSAREQPKAIHSHPTGNEGMMDGERGFLPLGRCEKQTSQIPSIAVEFECIAAAMQLDSQSLGTE